MYKARENLEKWVIAFILVLMGNWSYSQVLKVEDTDRLELPAWTSGVSCDLEDCLNRRDELILAIREQGYVLADLDIREKGDTVFVSIRTGPRYTWGNLDQSMVPGALQLSIEEGPFDPVGLEEFFGEVIHYYENRGYPMAKVGLDSLVFTGTKVFGRILVEKGTPYYFNGISDRNNNLRSRWMERFTGIRRGDPYEEGLLSDLDHRLSLAGITFDSLDVDFRDGYAQVWISSKTEEQNSFDGILGLQQDPVTGNLAATGYVDMRLSNLFKAAQTLELSWERFRKESQVLHIGYHYPALIGRTGFGLSFGLRRVDTSFYSRNFDLRAISQLGKSKSIEWGYVYRASTFIGETSNSAQQDDAILGTFSNHNLSLGFSNINDVQKLRLIGSVGYKNITEMSNEPDAPQGYTQVQLELSYSRLYNWAGPWSQLFRVDAGLVDAGIFSSGITLVNEYFQAGGINSVRGFNEQSIFAKSYMNLRNDLRLGLASDSFIVGFIDMGWMEALAGKLFVGWGSGFDLKTGNSGRLRFLVAWGRSDNEKTNWADPKIHFGYVAKF